MFSGFIFKVEAFLLTVTCSALGQQKTLVSSTKAHHTLSVSSHYPKTPEKEHSLSQQ